RSGEVDHFQSGRSREPSKGSQTLPRRAPPGKARLRPRASLWEPSKGFPNPPATGSAWQSQAPPTRLYGNPRSLGGLFVPKPSRDGLRLAKPGSAHASLWEPSEPRRVVRSQTLPRRAPPGEARLRPRV